MTAGNPAAPTTFLGPADAPEFTDAFFQVAEKHVGGRLVRRGTPSSENPKEAIDIRLAADVLPHHLATGQGWQTRIAGRRGSMRR